MLYASGQNHSGAPNAPCDQEDVGPPCKGSRCFSILLFIYSLTFLLLLFNEFYFPLSLFHVNQVNGHAKLY